jgi:hypothetical protein
VLPKISASTKSTIKGISREKITGPPGRYHARQVPQRPKPTETRHPPPLPSVRTESLFNAGDSGESWQIRFSSSKYDPILTSTSTDNFGRVIAGHEKVKMATQGHRRDFDQDLKDPSKTPS